MTQAERSPTCWIIAGPNDAGKTIFAFTCLAEVSDCRHLVNADLIVASLSPLAPESGRVSVDRTICYRNAGASPELVFIQSGDRRTVDREDVLATMKEFAAHAE